MRSRPDSTYRDDAREGAPYGSRPRARARYDARARWPRRLATAWIALSCLVPAVQPAWAEPIVARLPEREAPTVEDRERALDAYARARSHFAAGEFEQALRAAGRALDALPNASTALVRAAILAELGHHREAFESYLAARDLEPVGDELALIEAGLATHGLAHAPPLGWLRIEVRPLGAVVEIDGAAVPNGRTIGLAEGRHILRGSAAGYAEVTDEVPVARGLGATWARSLEVAARPADTVSAPTTEPGQGAPDTAAASIDEMPVVHAATDAAGPSDTEMAAWILLGGGLAMAAGAAGLHVWALDAAAEARKYQDPVAGLDDGERESRFEQARTDAGMRLAATGVLYGVGGAAVVASAALFIVVALGDEPSEAPVVAPVALGGGAGVIWAGRF